MRERDRKNYTTYRKTYKSENDHDFQNVYSKTKRKKIILDKGPGREFEPPSPDLEIIKRGIQKLRGDPKICLSERDKINDVHIKLEPKAESYQMTTAR